MMCPLCNAPSEVKETRIKVGYVYRRRICFNEHLFTSHEKIVKTVEKKNDRKDCTN